MSDYENDQWIMEDDEYDDNPPVDYTNNYTNNECVVVETSMTLKRKDETKKIQFIIRFGDFDVAQDSHITEYYQDLPRIEEWIHQHYSGWKFFNIETVCFSDLKHWNLDLSHED